MLKTFIANLVGKYMSKKLNDSIIKEEDISELLKQIRINLLDADVNFLVVKDFLKSIRAKSIGQYVETNSDPQQFILSIIKNELIRILGGSQKRIISDKKFIKVMLVGLQGSGKTTTCGKLAYFWKNKFNRKPLLVALDIYRPAAIDQLKTLSEQASVNIFQKENLNPVDVAKESLEFANGNNDFIIFDTAGRLQTNETLMEELLNIKKTVSPDEILLVVDSMSGQDMINVAKEFNDRLHLTGFIITKMDSDARAGVALSLTNLLNVPIKYIGEGEKLSDLNEFFPDRMANRILGLGDIVTLAEKAKEVVDEKSIKKTLIKMLSGKMDFEDLLILTKQVNKMGSFGSIIKMLPNASKLLGDNDVEGLENKIKIWTTLFSSMTLKERKNPHLFKKQVTRRERVIKGSGRKPDEFNKLYNTWEKMKVQIREVGNRLKKGINPFESFI